MEMKACACGHRQNFTQGEKRQMQCTIPIDMLLWEMGTRWRNWLDFKAFKNERLYKHDFITVASFQRSRDLDLDLALIQHSNRKNEYCIIKKILQEKSWVWYRYRRRLLWKMGDWRYGWSCSKERKHGRPSSKCYFQIYGMSISIYG